VSVPSPDQTAALQRWDRWSATGRLAVKSAQEGFNAHFEWHQTGPDSELLVEGPFGAGRSTVRMSADRIRVEAGSGPAMEFVPPFSGLETALTERVGFAVPLHALSYWLKGVPDPEVGNDVDVGGGFTQDHWQVRIEERSDTLVAGVGLPRKLTLLQGVARIRVVLDRWEGHP
jgi:outer membrane lipoprotein LolB